SDSTEAPAGRAVGKLLLGHGEDRTRPHLEHEPFSRIEFPAVLCPIVNERLRWNLRIGQSTRDTRENDCLRGVFSAHRAVRVLLQILRLASLGTRVAIPRTVE